MVQLREITKENYRAILRLQVAPSQNMFVATNAQSIAEAHFQPESAWFRAIYHDDTPVGFIMLEENPEKGSYYLWRMMIDMNHQGNGFGAQAIKQLIAHVKTRPKATSLLVSYVPGEGTPAPFYEKLGFVPTGEVEDGEIVAKLSLGGS